MNRRHGFVQRTINLFFIVLACGLLLSVSGVSSERPTQNALNSTTPSTPSTQNTPRYSDWQKTDPTQRVGSFSLVKKPESEIIYNALSTRWRNVLGETISEQSLLSFAQSGIRSKLIAEDDATPLDFRQWLLDRRQYIASQLTEGTADYLTQYGIGQAESNAGALSFVKTIDWDYQSGVGNRKWQTGLSALGALRQTDDDAIVWQLRGYAAEESSAGVNAGLIYRSAVGETLLGANTFLDYEKHGEYNKSFLRSSFGLELRSAHVNLYANRYWAITDPIADGDQFIYSKDGFDVEVAIKPLPELNISGGATYYKWDGEFGDADDKGVLYNLRVRPFSDTLKNIEIETQLDSPAEGDTDWGGKISYKYQFGAPLGSRLSTNPLTFDPRAHFFDPVRREYNQRIARSEGDGASGNNITFNFTSLLSGTGALTGTITLQALQTNGNTVVHTLTAKNSTNITAPTITINAGAGTALSLAGATWQATLSENSTVVLLNYGRTISLIAGNLYLKRNIGEKTPDAIAVGSGSIITVSLLGTELKIARGTAPVIASVGLDEGEIQIELTDRAHLQIEVAATATAHIIINDGSTTLLTVGCATSQQRDAAKYLNDSYNGCADDLHLGGSNNASMHLDTQGEQLILTVNASGTIAVAGDYQSTWDNYPFNPAYATLSIASGNGTLFYGTATVAVATSTRLETRTDSNAVVHLLLREGSISGIDDSTTPGDSVDCDSTNLADRAEQTEGDLTILAACGAGITFDNVTGDTINFNSRVSIASTIVISVSGGDGNYNFELDKTGIVSLVNTTGIAATLALLSADEEPATSFVLSASPTNPFIAGVLGSGNININAEVVEELRLDSTASKIFRTELDSNTPLLTLNLIGRLGTSEYTFVGAVSSSYTLATVAANASQVILSLGAAIDDETITTFTIQAIDDDSAGTGTTVTASITLTAIAKHPAGETARIDLQGGYATNNTVIINHLYRGVIASVVNITNAGDFSGLSNNSGYNLAIISPSNSGFLSTSAVAGSTENRAIDINVNSAPTSGTTNITVNITDDHSGNGTLTLDFDLQVVSSLSIASPGGTVSEISSNSGVVATVYLAPDTGLAPYTYSIVSPTDDKLAGAFSVDGNGIVSFTLVSGLETTTAIVTARVTDKLDDSADFLLTLAIYTPLSVSATSESVTVGNAYTSVFYTPSNLISGGRTPYTYTINAVQSTISALNSTSGSNIFNINNNSGALSLNSAVSSGIATVLVSVTDDSDGSAGYNVIVRLVDGNNALTFAASAASVTIRSSARGNIATITATWTDGNLGVRNYQLGTINPASVSDKFAVNSNNGELTLISPLAGAQTISAEIIASSDAVLGIAEVTTTVEIEAIVPIAFAAGNLQAITITTQSTQNNLFTVSAAFAAASISYRVTNTNFSTSGNTINLVSGINNPTTTELEIIATEKLFEDSTTLTVSVNIVDPPALTLLESNTNSNFRTSTSGKIADLTFSGGQGDYIVSLPENTADNADFALITTAGGSSATLNLSNSNISTPGTRTVVVVLDDGHGNTLPQTLAITITLLEQFGLAGNAETSAVYRTQLDSGIAILTLQMAGNLGAVTYSIIGGNPALQGLFNTVSAGTNNNQFIIILQSQINSERTNTFTVEAKDNDNDNDNAATVSIAVTLSAQHPQTETADLTLQGFVDTGTLIINNAYSGIIASLSNIRNPGDHSGLSSNSSGYILTQPTADSFIDIVPAGGSTGVLENGNIAININSPLAVGVYTISAVLNDDHINNSNYSFSIPIQVVNSLSISPAGVSNDVSNINGAVATLALATNTGGLAPYTYSISAVNSSNSALTTSSFSINNASTSISTSATSATITYSKISELSDTVVTLIARATDTIGDTADFTLTLTIYQSLGAPPTQNVTIHRTYIAGSFHTLTPDDISGGSPPYAYAISAVISDNSELTTNSFNINSNSGALILNTAFASATIATVVVEVRDRLADSTTYSVVVILSDNAPVFSNNAPILNIRTTDNGNIGTITVNGGASGGGAIRYRLGTTIPVAAAANISVNSSSGELNLISALGSEQNIRAEIIASSDSPRGAAATATVAIKSFTPITFVAADNPQAVTAITRRERNALFTVNANFAGDITYSVGNNNNFSTSGNVINLTNGIDTASEIALEIVASETLLDETVTLAVTVNIITPPALNLAASNIQNNVFINSTAKIADLSFSGGAPAQGTYDSYSILLQPANAVNDTNFAISTTAGDSTAVLNLINNTISSAATLTATLVLYDSHPDSTPHTLEIPVVISPVIVFANNSGLSVAHRTELDSNIGLLTLNVFGVIGVPTYEFVGTATANYAFTPSADYKQVIISLEEAESDEKTTTLVLSVVNGSDSANSSGSNATALITVEISSVEPQRESFEIAYAGREYGDSSDVTYVHNFYTGVIGSITISSQGKFSGLAGGSRYSVITTPLNGFVDVRVREKTDNEQELELYLATPYGSNPTPVNRLFRIQVSDDHTANGNGSTTKNFLLLIAKQLALESSGINTAVQNTVGGAVATVTLVTNTGDNPYLYEVVEVNTSSPLQAKLSAALTFEFDDLTNSREGILSFNPVAELTESAVLTAILRVTDDTPGGDTEDFILTLTVIAPAEPLVVPAPQTVTVQRNFTGDFYTSSISSGTSPYSYTINEVISSNLLGADDFLLNNTSGALRLATTLSTDITATVVIDVSDSATPQSASGTLSVIVEFIDADNALSFVTSAATVTIRSTDDSGSISSATATWANGNIGAIKYRLGETTPAVATANFAVNSNGALILAGTALGAAQVVSAEIIAYSDAIIGINGATATVEINVLTPITFVTPSADYNPQAVTATTRAVQNALFTVSASFANAVTYGINNNSDNFNISGNTINLTNGIDTAKAITLGIVASETTFNDKVTLTVTVNLINPPALVLSASNVITSFFTNATTKIADLALAGGFTQDIYTVSLYRAADDSVSIGDANFAISHTAGDSTAALHLTNAISAETTLVATIVLDDIHPATEAQTLEITVAVLAKFVFDDSRAASATYRTELDNNIGLLTLEVFGAQGAVSYDFVDIGTLTQFTLGVGNKNSQVIVSLQSTVHAESTVMVTVAATDTANAKTSITLTLISKQPGAVLVTFSPGNRTEAGYGNNERAYFSNEYAGIIGSITISNSDGLSGLTVGGSYTVPDTDDWTFEPVEDSQGREFKLRLKDAYTTQFNDELYGHADVDDDHVGNGVPDRLHIPVGISRKIKFGSTTTNAEIASTVSANVATIQLVTVTVPTDAFHGLGPYSYKIAEVNTDSVLDSTLYAQLSNALTVITNADRSDSDAARAANRLATISFSGVNGLTENTALTVIINASDHGVIDGADAAQHTLFLTVTTPPPVGLVNTAANTVEVFSNVGGDLATITLVDGSGAAPFSYEILEVKTTSTLSVQLLTALTVESSSDGRSGTVIFGNLNAGRNNNFLLSVITRVSDSAGSSADHTVALTVRVPLTVVDEFPTLVVRDNQFQHFYNEFSLPPSFIFGGLKSNPAHQNNEDSYAISIAARITDSGQDISSFGVSENSLFFLLLRSGGYPGEFTVTLKMKAVDRHLPTAESIDFTITALFTDSEVEIADTTLTIFEGASVNIGAVTAGWSRANLGNIAYNIESQPAGTGLQINSETGVLALTNPLGNGQKITVQIKASSNSIYPIHSSSNRNDDTAIVVIEAIAPIYFDPAENPQAAITTTAPQDNLFTVTASGGSGNYEYRISDSYFSITNTNGVGIVALTSNIRSAVLDAVIIAEDTTFGNSATLSVAVRAVPNALTLTASNVRATLFFNTPEKVAELTFAGGLPPYKVAFQPANSNDFALDFTADNTTAILNLTNTAINTESTRIATVVLDDSHTDTEAQTLAFTITILPPFALGTFDNAAAAIVHRTELDEKVDLITLAVANALGAVSYNFVGSAPSLYTLSQQGNDDKQIIISLTVAVADPTTSIFAIEAVDSNALFTNTASITVTVEARHPQQEEIRVANIGGEYLTFNDVPPPTFNHLYTGVMFSITVFNPSANGLTLSGLRNAESNYSLTLLAANANTDISNLSIKAVDGQNRVVEIFITAPLAVGKDQNFKVRFRDEHSGNDDPNDVFLQFNIIPSLTVTPAGVSANTHSDFGGALATITLKNINGVDAGLKPYSYEIIEVTTDSSLSTQLSSALKVRFRESSAVLRFDAASFNANNVLANDVLLTAIIRISDAFGESADFAFTLNVYTPLVAPANENLTVHHTYIAAAFHTPASNSTSGGKPPYTYAINTVQSTISALTNSSFSIDENSGALALSVVANAGIATVVVAVSDDSDVASGTKLYSVIVALTDNALALISASPQTVSIRTNQNGSIVTVTADWTDGENDFGAVTYRLGATTPEAAAANMTVDSTSGALMLFNALINAQTVTAEVIATGGTGILGIAEVTAQVEIAAFLPLQFNAADNLQIVAATTNLTLDGLFTVSAAFAAAVTYSIDNEDDDRFNIGVSNGVVELTVSITTPQAIALTVVANEDLFNDTATLIITVDVVHPPALELSATNVSRDFRITSAASVKIADLSFSGGFLQGSYSVSLLYNAASDVNFVIATTAGGAVLSLTTAAAATGSFIATVVLDDQHTATDAQTLKFTVALLSMISFASDNVVSIVHRTELDEEIDVLTLRVVGNLGAVSYQFGGTAPTAYVLSTLDGDDTQIKISLTVGTDDQKTTAINIEAVDDSGSATSTATIAVTIYASHPQPVKIRGARIGEGYEDEVPTVVYVNKSYTGPILSVTIGNPGKLSGVKNAQSNYVLRASHASNLVSSSVKDGVLQNREIVVRVLKKSSNSSATYQITYGDGHSGNGDGETKENYRYVLSEPLIVNNANVNANIYNNVSGAVATINFKDGLRDFRYEITEVNTSSPLSVQLSAALFLEYSTSRDRHVPVNFNAVNGLADGTALTAVIRARGSALGDEAYANLVISIFSPLIAPTTDSVTVQRNYTAADFYTPSADNSASGGKPPYTYTIDGVSSANNALTFSSFSINSSSGALALSQAASAGTATVTIGIAGAVGKVAYNVVVALIDNALSAVAAETITIRTSASGNIATVAAVWTDGDDSFGVIDYALGAITPVSAAANIALNPTNGALSLISPLASRQTLSVQIIASSDVAVGISDVASEIEIVALPSLRFNPTSLPRVTLNTQATRDDFLQVTTNVTDGVTYSVDDARFSTNGNTINLINAVDTPTVLDLEIVASETYFGESATLTATVEFVSLPSLVLTPSNIINQVRITSAAKIADLAISGGTGSGYVFNITSDYFAINYTAGDSTAELLLTNSTIIEAATLTATVVLDDQHFATVPHVLEFTVTVFPLLNFVSNNNVSLVYRTELDSNINLATLNLAGAAGAIDYGFVGSEPSRYVLNPVGDGSAQVMLFLNTTVHAEATTALTIRATDNNFSATADITVTVFAREPKTEQAQVFLDGVEPYFGQDDTKILAVREGFTGDVATISISNPGTLSGLAEGASYKVDVIFTGSTDGIYNIIAIAETQGREYRINRPLGLTGEHLLRLSIDDSHKGNDSAEVKILIDAVKELEIKSPGGISNDTSNSAGAVATMVLETGTGGHPFRYTIQQVSSDLFSAEISSALSISSYDRVGRNRAATAIFSPIAGLTANIVATVNIRVTDKFDDTVDFALTLTVYPALVSEITTETATLARTYTAAFSTPQATLVSAGNPPYSYAISTVDSANSALTADSFGINSANGALSLNAALNVAAAGTATVVIEITDNSAVPSTATYSVIAVLVDNGLSFSNTAATVTISDLANGNIAAVTASWDNTPTLGEITYQLGAVTPADAAANFTVNAETGALTLINALDEPQTINVKIIASSDAVTGVEATANIEVESYLQFRFDANSQLTAVYRTELDNNIGLVTLDVVNAVGAVSFDFVDIGTLTRFTLGVGSKNSQVIVSLQSTVHAQSTVMVTVAASDAGNAGNATSITLTLISKHPGSVLVIFSPGNRTEAGYGNNERAYFSNEYAGIIGSITISNSDGLSGLTVGGSYTVLDNSNDWTFEPVDGSQGREFKLRLKKAYPNQFNDELGGHADVDDDHAGNGGVFTRQIPVGISRKIKFGSTTSNAEIASNVSANVATIQLVTVLDDAFHGLGPYSYKIAEVNTDSALDSELYAQLSNALTVITSADRSDSDAARAANRLATISFSGVDGLTENTVLTVIINASDHGVIDGADAAQHTLVLTVRPPPP